MELLLDTGNVAKIRNAMEYYPVSGVTTNPTILRKEGDVPFWDLIGEIKELIGPQRSLHVQTISSDADGIIREAGIIAERLGMDTYIKIPVDREGLKAIKELASEGFRITATAIYTELQGVLAAMAGASYLAVYYNRMENTSIDADDVIKNLSGETRDVSVQTASDSSAFYANTTILEGMYKERVERALKEVLEKDEKYCRVNEETNQKIKDIDQIELTKEEWEIIDTALSAANARSAEYGRVSYQQGFLDAVSLLRK